MKNSRWDLRLNDRAIRVITSALDPVISSATVFLVQGLVLVSANKTEFAAFSLSYSYIVMGQAVLSALFGGPLVTLLGKLSNDDDRRAVGDGILRFQVLASSVLGLSSLGATYLIGIPFSVSLLGVICFLGLSFRDVLRSILAAQLRFKAGLIISLAFASVTTVGLVTTFVVYGNITAVRALAVLAVGAGIAVLPHLIRGATTSESLQRNTIRELAGLAVWSLPGAGVIWLQNSFYLTLLAINLNLAAVGEVSAARMLIMPILIVTSGMLRLVQVQASRQIADRGISEALGNARRGVLLCLATGFAASAICFIVNGFVNHAWLPRAYPHLLTLGGAWMLFATATTARGIYSALFQAMGRYREIFIYNAALLPLVLAGIAIGPKAIGLIGAILPMATGEILLLIFLMMRAGASAPNPSPVI